MLIGLRCGGGRSSADRNNLAAAANLEAAVRVDPQALRMAAQYAGVHEGLDLAPHRLHRRHRRAATHIALASADPSAGRAQFPHTLEH